MRGSANEQLSVGERIRQSLNRATPSERRVARVLLGGPPSVGLESSARLATAARVSGPTVSRFVAHLGFGSYAEFQQAWRTELDERMLTPVAALQRHRTHTDRGELLKSATRILIDALADTLTNLSADNLETATALLTEPRARILMIGGWFSRHLAEYFATALQQIRENVHLVSTAPSNRAAAIADAKPSDVLVCFDFRRYETATRNVAQGMHDRHARIVLLTDPWLSPIAEIADAVLTANVDSPSQFESLTTTLALVDVLLAGVVERLGERGRQRFEAFEAVAEPWLRPWSTASDGLSDGHSPTSRTR